jgi:hypothetical protein
MKKLIVFSLILVSNNVSNHSIYVLNVNDKTLIFTSYVYDLVITRSNLDLILGLKK